MLLENKLISANYGLILASDRYGKFPGHLVGLNVDIVNKGGVHVRFKNMEFGNNEKRKVIELGLHTSTNYTNKYSIKALGATGIIILLVMNGISNST